MPTTDEGRCRRPDFTPGRVITLADGQGWHFPEPFLTGFAFTRGKDGRKRMTPAYDLDAGYDRLVSEYEDAVASGQARGGGDDEWESFQARALAVSDLADYLLRLNYDLTDEQLAALLPCRAPGRPDYTENRAMWDRIREVALGLDPKGPGSTGSAPASSPTA